jgi:hypothetical protein
MLFLSGTPGVMVLKPIMRTTVILDEELRKKLKMLSLQKDISMKDIITQALEEKIQRELTGAETSDEFSDNPVVTSIGKVLEPPIGSVAAKLLIAQTCRKFGTSTRKLSRGDITAAFIEAICQKVLDIASEDDAGAVRKELSLLSKKK